MQAEKKRKVITSWRVKLPSQEATKKLANYMQMNENTLKGYLNVSNNRSAPRAIDAQVAAINLYGGVLVQSTSYEDCLYVEDDDHTVVYELN